MAKVEKLPSGNYQIRVYNKYTKKQKAFVASSAKEVKAMAFEYLSSISAEDKEDCTVKQAIERYIENRSKVLSPSTILGYDKLLKNNFKEIENCSISNITSEQIQRYINNLSAHYSPKTIRNTYGLLISSIKAVKPNKAINVSLPNKKPVQRHIPTDKDIQDLLDNANRYLRISILLSSIGTLRRGEICALKYEDISGNTIHVHADIIQNREGQWVYKDMPKNASSDRFIELPPELIKELGTGEGFIITVIPGTITKEFIKLRNRLGLLCKFHDLRHYAASMLHAIGVPDAYIMKRGGWSSDTVLKDVYRNALDDKEKQFSDMANSYMSKFLEDDSSKGESNVIPSEQDAKWVKVREYAEKYNMKVQEVWTKVYRGTVEYTVINGKKYVNINKPPRNRVKEYKYFEGPKSSTRIYRIWTAIKMRCTDVNSTSYRYYGGKGIKMCDEWLNSSDAFIEWAYTHGYNDELEIDRIDTLGNYEPRNCRFVTREENNKNRYFTGEHTFEYKIESIDKFDLDNRMKTELKNLIREKYNKWYK